MRTIILALLFVAIFAHLANADEPKSVRYFADGSRIECYGSYCKRFPAVAKIIDAVPTPADIREKPVEAVSVASPVEVRSVLVTPVQATRSSAQTTRASRPMRRWLFGS